MKKIIALLLALCLLLTFTACDGKKENKETKPDGGEPSVPAQTTPAETTESVLDIDNRYEDDSKYEGGVTIPETVLYDAKDIKIVATRVDVSWDEPVIIVEVENNSDKDINVSVGNLIINGVSTYGDLTVDVSAGKKAVAELEVYSLYLAYAKIGGLDEIGSIGCEGAEIFDDKWNVIDTFGFDIRTSIADTMKYTPDVSGNVIYEDDYIKVTHQPDFEAYMGDEEYMFVIENKQDCMLDINFDDISVNGYMANVFAYGYVSGKTVCFVPMTICDDDLTELGIKAADITEVSFKVEYSDMDYELRKSTEEITVKID